MPLLLRVLALLPLLAADPSAAMIAGGGDPARGCWMEFEAPGRTLNYPRAPRIGREVRCFDGEAGCDIDVCFHNTDPDFPTCSPVEVTGAIVKRAKGSPGLEGLQSAIDTLGAVTTPTCTSGQSLEVPLRLTSKGKEKWDRERVAVRTLTTSGKAIDRLRLACLPNE